VKLLLDENLSPKLVRALAADFPGSSQVELLGLRGSTDRTVWDVARDHEYTIVSKDNDFRQRVEGRDLARSHGSTVTRSRLLPAGR
jgi:predicted nuclease of predicted toxin-antitoxin system